LPRRSLSCKPPNTSCGTVHSVYATQSEPVSLKRGFLDRSSNYLKCFTDLTAAEREAVHHILHRHYSPFFRPEKYPRAPPLYKITTNTRNTIALTFRCLFPRCRPSLPTRARARLLSGRAGTVGRRRRSGRSTSTGRWMPASMSNVSICRPKSISLTR
jgi:hypothetical protein